MTTSRPVSIAILAGGGSTRFGTDKALASLEPDGPPLLQIAIDRVRILSDDLFIVSPPRAIYATLGPPVLPDLYPGTGPLGGIASAIRHARHERCLVVSCDHPFLNRALLRAMIDDPDECDVLVPVLSGASRQGGTTVRQTLHAIYRTRCLPAIERRLAEGRLQVVGFYDDVDVKELPEEWARVYDPQLRSFFSANTPVAIETARQWLRDSFGDGHC